MLSNIISLRVAQYNVLSQRCAKNDERGFPHVDPRFLLEKVRASKIVAQILRADPDVVCLQEFDHTVDGRESHLKKSLLAHYDFFGSVKDDRHTICVAVKRDCCWKPHICDQIRLKSSWTQEVGYVYMTHRETKREVLVLTTHLKSGAENVWMRALQMAKLIKTFKDSVRMPVILAGDLNCEPSECAYNMLVHSPLGMKSVYEREERTGSHFTTRKMRAQEKCVCEDYIFYTPSQLKVLNKHQLPPRNTIPYPYLPNEEYGSDHLMLTCDFQFN